MSINNSSMHKVVRALHFVGLDNFSIPDDNSDAPLQLRYTVHLNNNSTAYYNME